MAQDVHTYNITHIDAQSSYKQLDDVIKDLARDTQVALLQSMEYLIIKEDAEKLDARVHHLESLLAYAIKTNDKLAATLTAYETQQKLTGE